MNVGGFEGVFKKKAQDGKKAIIPFLPGGYPSLERFWDYIVEMDECGADIIEIGVPFSDPVADGEVVERASNVALSNGVSLGWILEGLSRVRERISTPVVLMGYCNPFFRYRWERFARDAAGAGVDGVIVADLPLEESSEIEEILLAEGIELIYLIGLNTSTERMQMYASHSRGFVYFVSVLGTTGIRESLPAELQERLTRAREIFSCPISLGFGISSPSQLGPIASLIDGIVFGSALIRHLDEKGEIRSFFERWK